MHSLYSLNLQRPNPVAPEAKEAAVRGVGAGQGQVGRGVEGALEGEWAACGGGQAEGEGGPRTEEGC